MKITRSDSEKLVIVDFPYLLGGLMMIIALAILGHFFWQVAHVGIHQVEWLGHGFGFALTFLGAVLLLRRSEFEFDLARRQLIWSRTGLFGRRGELVPFSQIKCASVEASSDADRGITYRVSLKLVQGVLPLTVTRGSFEWKCMMMRDAINQALGLPAQTETQDDADIRALVAKGQRIAAIALRRHRRACGLKEAKDIVEAMGVAAPAQAEVSPADVDVRALLAKGNAIGAIKLVRQRRGCGLREAKDIVDAMGRS